MFRQRASNNDTLYLCPPPVSEGNERYQPLRGPIIYGYPSGGGVLVKGVHPVELQHLKVDRFQDAMRATDEVKEDEFCKQLRRIGATWWPSKEAETDAQLARSKRIFQHVATGWPSSGRGVWVWRQDTTDIARKLQFALVRLALNMDERCEVIKNNGGEYFEDPDDCKDLRMDTMKDGIED